MGTQGQSLMTKFGITSIPALELLDGNGSVVFLDGYTRITEDPMWETGTTPDWLTSLQSKGGDHQGHQDRHTTHI